MAVSVSCPQCHASFPVSAELLGKKMRCRGCQTVFVGEAATAKVGAGSAAAPRPATPSSYAQPRPTMDDASKKSADNTAMLAFVGIGTAVALMTAVTVWAVFFRGGDSDNNSNNSVAVNNVSKINLGDTAKEEAAKKVETPKETPKVEKPVEKAKITVAKFHDTPKSFPFRIDPMTEERAKKSAIWVKVGSHDGGGGTGTGWMVEPGIMITNSHVVGMKDPSAAAPAFVKAVFDSGTSSERIFNCKILGLDRDNDLAVCRIEGDNLPPPMPIVRSADLSEGQHLYVVGFPLGSTVAKVFSNDVHTLETTVKVRQTTVNGRLPRPNGSIKYVQIEGGASPGNSGSMIIDSLGNVRSVLVAGINAQIVFSIPSEYVVYLLEGRMLNLVPSQPIETDGVVRQQIAAWISDPMKRIKSVALEMWVGEPGKRIRPGVTSPPSPVHGDSPRQTVEMTYNATAEVPVGASREAKTEWKMPEVPDGHVVWLQPRYTTPDGKVRWGEAIVMDTTTLSVQRKPATLSVKHKAGESHKLRLESHIGIAAAPEHGELHLQGLGVNFDLTEKTNSVQPDGTAKIQLTYNNMRAIDADTDFQFQTMYKGMLETAKGMVAEMQVSKRGLIKSPKLSMKNVPVVIRTFMERFNIQTVQSLEALSLALPDRELKPGDTWQHDQNYTVAFGRQLIENALFKTTYRFAGTRLREGREEAVIEFDGKIVRVEGSEAPLFPPEEGQDKGKGKGKNAPLRIRGMHGEVRGAAFVDVATGLASHARTAGTLEFEVPHVGQVLKFGAALRIELQREVVPNSGIKTTKMTLPNQEVLLNPFVGSPDHKLTLAPSTNNEQKATTDR